MKVLIIISAFFMWVNSSYAQDLNFEGKFVNSNKQTILITNYKKGQSFDYSYKYGVNDEWGCMFEGEGTAMLIGDDFFYDGSEISFIVGSQEYPDLSFVFMDETTLSIQPSSEWIGMDCARYGESQEETYTVFIKQ